MDVNLAVIKMKNEINGKNRKDAIDALEENLIDNIEELSKSDDFFTFPLTNIFSVISKVVFSNLNEKSVALNVIKNIVQKTIKAHFNEKETLLLIHNIDITNNFFSYEEIISILELFTNCTFLTELCNSYNEKIQIPEKDFEYEISLRDKEIQKLKQQISQSDPNKESESKNISNFANDVQPISEKPKDIQYNIFTAVLNGQLASVQWLIEKENIDKDINGNWDETPLHWACRNSQLQIAEYLISKGANTKAKSSIGDYVIHFAAIGGLLPIVQYIIEKQNVNTEIQGNKGKTPLHYACENGHLPIVEYLISKGANVNSKDENGNYAIHYASENGHLQIVQYLIEKQNVNTDIRGNKRRTSLHYACIKDHSSIVEYLISKGANINAITEDGETPLHWACRECHLKIAEYLISKGANVNDREINGNYAIHFATIGGLLPIVQYLVEKQKVNINIKGNKERTPLHYACWFGQIPIAEYLISKGASKNTKDKDGKTPYDLAHNDKIRNLLGNN